MTNPAAEPLSAQSISGFRPKQDPISHEKKLAASVIFLAWKDACEGDKGAFSFAFSNQTLFPFWCTVCDLDVQAVRACFKRLHFGEQLEFPMHILYNGGRRRWRPSTLSVPEVRQAIEIFIKMRSQGTQRKEIFTWIALDMEKEFKTVEDLFYMLARKARKKRNNLYLTGLRGDFWEAWNGG